MIKNYFSLVFLFLFLSNIYSQTTAIPDANFEQALIAWGIDSDGTVNGSVLTSDISTVLELNVDGQNISDLTGIEGFTSLTALYCRENQLTSLDVSQNTALTTLTCEKNQLTSLDVSQNTALIILQCGYNQLTSLDVTQNTALTQLTCWFNQLTSLDVSQNTALEWLVSRDNPLTSLDVSQNTNLTLLVCMNNQLTSLNVKNGNNSILTTSFNSSGNPNLQCIEVDNAIDANAGTGFYSTWVKDDTAHFSEDCLNTRIPDANFEQALIDLGIDSDITVNGSVLTSDISGVLFLSVTSRGISDLTGIEGFISLTTLECAYNPLTSLDVSQNTNLTELRCQYNQLTSLDVSQNTNLTDLFCGYNQLTSLDVGQNTALTQLICWFNQLTSLDVTQNTNLTFLVSSDNPLTSLDVSQNTNLTFLVCYYNQLTSLDVSQNTNLTDLFCADNQLTSLNVKNGNNSNFTGFNALNNPNLFCIQVDNASYSTTNWLLKDATSTYSENCGYLGLDDELLSQSISFYPNPVTNLLTIDSEIPLTKVEIYSVLGRKVKEVNSDFNSIPTDNLSNGVYIFKIYSENGLATKKLIKK